ncbi:MULTISPECIES: lanthionine synthetase C family protein [Bacillus]|uniref:Lanthionine synthetase C-like protein n=3 Tax=Bacillus cereus group TaxID=86661 RepID=A0A9X5N462_BACTU|nr:MULTISPECIES: lanthionine synthetase C family protein [Bacillus]AHX21948.1 hypothetical protein CY96_27565 [Bacillus bombysepticus str. Wang]KAA1804723.1 Nisin biosynthesis protein NisC [Bacillus cereus]MCU5321414.1 lanthionine synthetase C family protein [Bacillus cereus]OFC91285.1 Lanthionine synthetase C-like protein [Bacillus thuringiensis]PFA44894.1 hypothetical protein CN381_14200 [Bacillus cereus]
MTVTKNFNYIIQEVTSNLIINFKTPEELMKFMMEDKNNEHIDSDYTLASGLSGLLLLISQLQKEEIVWNEYGYECMKLLNKYISDGKINNLSLWGGLTGIAASAYLLSNKGEYYSNFINQLNEIILDNLSFYLGGSLNNLTSSRTTSLDFEAIYGLAGITRYLLFFKENPKVNEMIRNILNYFIQLNNKVNYREQKVPGYFISEGNQLNNDSINYPGGHLDLGLSHGMCGPLSVMALSLEHGIEQPGQISAINDMVEQLLKWMQKDQEGVWWPTKINFNEFINEDFIQKQDLIYGWCYGTPGVARILWICGRALNNKEYQEIALSAYKAICKKDFKNLKIQTPTFCHGISGILHLTHLMYIESFDKELLSFKNNLAEKILQYYDAENPLGFYDITYSGKKNLSIGALDGVSGILAVLNSINSNEIPEWSFLYLTN